MNRLSILHPLGVQILELESLNGDKGNWRQVTPIAARNARTLESGHGTWKWVEHNRTYVSGRTSMTVTAQELQIIDGDGRYFSLGFFQKREVPLNTWRYGYYGGVDTRLLRPGQTTMPRSNLVWCLQQQVDFTSAWVGIFAKVGGQAAAAGAESGLGVIFNVAQPSSRYLIGITTGRAGPGLGGSIGVAVGVLTGFNSARAMVGHTEKGWDFALSIEEKWDDYVKFLGSSAVYTQLAAQLSKYGSLLKLAKDPKPQLMAAANELSSIGDIYKVVNTGNGSLGSSGPTVSIFDIPGAGKGLEIGVYRTWTQIVDVQTI